MSFSRSIRTLGIALSSLVVLPSASCKKAQNAAKPAPSGSSRAERLPPNVDPKLWGDLDALTKVCKVDIKENTLNCTQGEQRRLVSEFVAQQRDRAKATATFAAALADPRPELRAVGANVLYSAFRSPWGPNVKPGAVPPADAEAFVSATLKLPKGQAVQALPAAVHAAMLANRADALMAAIDKSGEAQLRTTAIRYLMTHGRLQAFPRVQEFAKLPDVQVALAALESPANMYAWTAEEQAAICPWAATFLEDPRAPIAAKAGSLLSNCSGEHVDRLLDVAEASLKKGDFTSARVGAFRDLCAAHRRARPDGASEKQCDRARKLLEDVVQAKALVDQARTAALAALAYQWPDKDTLKLVNKLAKDPNKSLAENATRTAARIEQRLNVAVPASSAKDRAKTEAPKAPVALSAAKTTVGAKPRVTVPVAPSPAAAKPATDNPF